ncbi:hypothetical protein BJV82DRAFT_525231 [Fennellomyces sp. T-0311]|nr:hypothetical protein BJV82DRAFT_525231 [Fennellomyces sp. T-0311]
MLVVTVGLPLALYYSTRNTIGTLYALLLSGAPPLLHTIYVFIRRRRLDVFGLLMVVAFVVSAVISIVTGDVRAALLRDSAVTALVSILFFVTLIPIKNKWISNRPLTFTIASQMLFENAPPYHWIDKDGQRHELSMSDWVWSMPKTRKLQYINTAGWSIGLMCEFIIRVIMVEATSLTTDQIILYGNIVVIIVVVTMTSFGIFVSMTSRKELRQWVKDNNYAARKEASRTEPPTPHENI